MAKKEWSALGNMLVFAGAAMVLIAVNMSDVKSFTQDATLASDTTLIMLSIIGCLSALIGAFIIDFEGGSDGERELRVRKLREAQKRRIFS